MFTPYGCITNKWFPAKLDGDLLAQDLEPTTLAPLAPHAKKLLIPRGIRTMNEWTANNKGAGYGRGQGNDWHTQVMAAAFTCQPVSPNSNDPFSFNQATKFNATAVGPSLDHVMAQQLSPLGVPLLMNVGGQVREGATAAISYSAANTIFPPTSAQDALKQLTGLFTQGQPSPDDWQISKGKLLADLVKDDLATLRRQDMSKADREKLSVWLELMNDVVTHTTEALCGESMARKLGASLPFAGGSDGDVVTRAVNDSMDNADIYSAIAVLTATCNANSVIFLKYPSDFIYAGLGITVTNDVLAHRVGSSNLTGPCVPTAVPDLLKLDSYYASKFANLVRMLDSVPEGDRTVLDNSIAIWMNECSDGLAHNLNNAPIIQAGSGGGYFRSGQIINLDADSGATPEQMLGRSLDQCSEGASTNADGVMQGTGTDPKFGNAPVNKYFCNLMNAMGMKADTLGFPAKDGPASEVTHFGYSDRTEDFCGGLGAVSSAAIHDPGGFNQLKA